jgi:hypothetical protein
MTGNSIMIDTRILDGTYPRSETAMRQADLAVTDTVNPCHPAGNHHKITSSFCSLAAVYLHKRRQWNSDREPQWRQTMLRLFHACSLTNKPYQKRSVISADNQALSQRLAVMHDLE